MAGYLLRDPEVALVIGPFTTNGQKLWYVPVKQGSTVVAYRAYLLVCDNGTPVLSYIVESANQSVSQHHQMRIQYSGQYAVYATIAAAVAASGFSCTAPVDTNPTPPSPTSNFPVPIADTSIDWRIALIVAIAIALVVYISYEYTKSKK